MNKELMFSSKRHDYGTPQELFDKWNEEFHFTCDPCATVSNAKCAFYLTPEQDGLKQKWFGNVFMNPPYGREIGKWIQKAYEEFLVGHCNLVVCLVPARTDTKWWHEYCMLGEIRFLRGRIKFVGAENCAPFPSALVIFRKTEVK